MRKLIFIAFASLFTVGCNNCTEIEKKTKIDTIPPEIECLMTREDTINAMALAFAQQESNFDNASISPGGKWVGCLQISEIMVREANRILGFECFYYEDRYDRQGSYAIFKIVQEYHNENLEIDKAISVWNPRCDNEYRENVKRYFYYNLHNYNIIENYFEI